MTDGPTCFLHVPKSAGTSIRVTLEAALPPGSLAPKGMEPSAFCGFDDFDRLGAEARGRVAVGESEIRALAGYRAVSGHFTLPTLASLAPLARIGTVLREPRSRLVSYYLFVRFSVSLRTTWAPYDIHSAAERSLAEFLAEPRLAMANDNRTCRMLLHGDPRIRDGEFLAEDDLGRIAEDAWERLEELGFVGILELPEQAWTGLGELFGVELEPARRNVTGASELQPGMLPVPPFGGAVTLELLERRSGADAVLYRRAAARSLGSEDGARRLADAAFAEQLIRYGAYTPEAGPPPSEAEPAPSEAESALRACREELERSEALVESFRRRSWRLTTPLRRAGRAIRRGP